MDAVRIVVYHLSPQSASLPPKKPDPTCALQHYLHHLHLPVGQVFNLRRIFNPPCRYLCQVLCLNPPDTKKEGSGCSPLKHQTKV